MRTVIKKSTVTLFNINKVNYELIDVPSDGKCFYHSIVASQKFKIAYPKCTSDKLCEKLVNFIEKGMDEKNNSNHKKIVDHLCNDKRTPKAIIDGIYYNKKTLFG